MEHADGKSTSCVSEAAVLASIFSDETELFRTPAEPNPGDTVSIRLRCLGGLDVRVQLLRGYQAEAILMEKVRSDRCFDWYETQIHCRAEPDQGELRRGEIQQIYYSFLLEWNGRRIHFCKIGARWINSAPAPDPVRSFRFTPGFHTPAWAKGAVQYQIFPDRFRNGDPDNDTVNDEYDYAGAHVRHAGSWEELPGMEDFRTFYGGDLKGVQEKLDYLQSLGVEVLYFNPIFVSPSSHKYDTQDYDHIDPHLTVISADRDGVLREGERQNSYAFRYIQRVTDPQNLAESDGFFARFCQELHRRGMRIILDGVFNHCGSFHKWMDRERIYLRAPGVPPGAFEDPRSPFRDYFHFYGGQDRDTYEGWWDFETLPKLNYEASRDLCEAVFQVAQKWAGPPWSIDGWRLDVAADLGHSREFNHLFWKEFRRRVKAVNPDILIIAEHYGNPAEWLRGDEWDTVMNYDAFMEPLTYFLTGLEKHSDGYNDGLYQNGAAFFDTMRETMARLPCASLQCAMNELSNHDHSRFLTRTNRRVGRLNTMGSAAAGEGIDKRVFRSAVALQMTWPGAPTIYYADEAGQVGWTDPDNRRTYPWGQEDHGLIALHRALTGLRKRFSALRYGSIKPLSSGYGFIAYARFDASGCVVVVCNNADEKRTLAIPVNSAGVPDGERMLRVFRTTAGGFDLQPLETGRVKDGLLNLRLPERSVIILSYRFGQSLARNSQG